MELCYNSEELLRIGAVSTTYQTLGRLYNLWSQDWIYSKYKGGTQARLTTDLTRPKLVFLVDYFVT